jgi:hypothetical protein
MVCRCNSEPGSYPGPCLASEAVTHVGCTLVGCQSVMLGVQKVSTFQIMCGAFQFHLMLMGVHFVMHLPSPAVH